MAEIINTSKKNHQNSATVKQPKGEIGFTKNCLATLVENSCDRKQLEAELLI